MRGVTKTEKLLFSVLKSPYLETVQDRIGPWLLLIITVIEDEYAFSIGAEISDLRVFDDLERSLRTLLHLPCV